MNYEIGSDEWSSLKTVWKKKSLAGDSEIWIQPQKGNQNGIEF
jgi:hypothetical protein